MLATFAAYLVVLGGIGVWASRFMDTVGDYVIGCREIGPVVTGTTTASGSARPSTWSRARHRPRRTGRRAQAVLARRATGGDVVVDSVTGTERPLAE